MRLSVVTASVDPERTRQYWESWKPQASSSYESIIVLNGCSQQQPGYFGFSNGLHSPEILGTVPAFAAGVALASGNIIACLHDDVAIEEPGWDERVLQFFDEHPACGLAAFSGCDGLGDANIYQRPYDPMQLARVGFFSNMREAEKHGRREVEPLLSACGDGFSQVGRASFIKGAYAYMQDKGVIHHAFDSWLGVLARRAAWDVWFIPVACHHAGGVTAVGSEAYQRWAAASGGDQRFWEDAHRAMYEDCKGELPIRVR